MARRSNQSSVLLFLAIFALAHSFYGQSVQLPASTQLPAFHHTSWENTGLGAVYDVRQDHNGYIWLQTVNGIYRFDGVKFLSVDEVTQGAVRNVSGLGAVLPAANGGIWFTPHKAALILWKNGEVQTFADSRCTGRLREAPDGSLWIAGSSGLFHFKEGVCEQIAEKWGMSTDVPSALLVDHEGTVWVKSWTGDLLFLKPGSARFQVSPYGGGATTTLSFLHEAPDGSVWLADGHGLREVRAAGNAMVPARPPGIEHPSKDLFGDFAFAEDGSIWIASADGARWAPRPQQWATPGEMAASIGQDLTMEQGLSSDVVWGIFADHEDNIWMATNSGIDQMRKVAFHAIRLPHVQEHQFGIAPGTFGSVWTGSESLPLTHVVGDKLTTYPEVGTITCLKQGRDGALWAASKGTNHLWRFAEGKFSKISYPFEAEQPIIALAIDGQNGVWISLRQYGVFHLSSGQWKDENAGLQKTPKTIAGITDDEAGNVWISFGRKLVEWNGGRYVTFSLPDNLQGLSGSLMSAENHHVWLTTSSGIVSFTGNDFHLLHFRDASLPGNISGLIETSDGDLWLNGFSGVTHVSRQQMAQWSRNPELSVAAERLEVLDGLPGLSGEAIPRPSVVASSDGRVWFATTKGIAWLDPLAFEQSRNRIPPPVVISAIRSNGTLQPAVDHVVFPAGTDRLEISYDALSFAVPQRVLFKYRLEGLDKDWQNAGTRREAFYNSLKPGPYRFRVLACNNDGVWNETGASISFTVKPAFYQTWWFELLATLAIVCIVRLLWSLRIGIITRSLQGRLSARLEERERIARELHDTLLQGIFGLTLRLQSSVDQLDDGHPVRTEITRALNQSDAMMLKGRERIKGLRDVHLNDAGLVATLEEHGRQLENISVVRFRLSVEGEPRQLTAPIEEELSLIGCEALTNAFRHARASLIQLEIIYRWNVFTVRISDDGMGVDPSVLAAGRRKDHWGLPSMRERAGKIRAKFSIGPGKSSGTVVVVQVPGGIVYRDGSKNLQRLWSIFQRVGMERQSRGSYQPGPKA